MIIYYSATGNCKYVAKKIADKTRDIAVSMIGHNDSIYLKKGESLGIVVPVHFWGLPAFVTEFLSGTDIKSEDENPYIFLIATFGSSPGYCCGYLADLIESKGFGVSAKFSILMVDTWTLVFNLSNEDKINKKTLKSDKQIGDVISKIERKEQGDFVKRKLPKFVCDIFRKITTSYRKTSHLNVDDKCVGCGLCRKSCPVKAIDLQMKKPVWVKNECVMCLRCLHLCPKFAIQYDNKTQNHGQYLNPHISSLD